MRAANDHPSDLPSGNASERLNSWKEIAGYLGRTVRTLQRWERDAGLPIRRLRHAEGATVYAFRRELDDWWRNRSDSVGPLRVELGSPEIAGAVHSAMASHTTHAPGSATVGRTGERRDLQLAFDRASAGHGRLLAISGEPGIGKTTLIEGFLATLAHDRRCFIGRGRSSESLAGTEAFLPLLDALDDLLRADTSGVLRRTMRASAPLWLAQLGPSDVPKPARGEGLGAAGAAQPQRIKRELLAFFQEACRVRPVVLFVDDIHWADSSTLDVLAYITRQIESLRLLVIVTYRSHEFLLRKHPFLPLQHDLEARGLCRSQELDLLSRDELGEYIARRFPGLPGSFADAVFARTEGNPLFMVSLLTYLHGNGAFEQHGDAWTLTATLGDLLGDVPESVRGMIRRTIDVIPDPERRVLAAASVHGLEFHGAVVARSLDIDEAEVEEHLQRLTDVHRCVDAVGEQELPDGTFTVRYRFVHVLYQEHLHSSLAPARLTELSRRAAAALAATHVGHTADMASRLQLALRLLFR